MYIPSWYSQASKACLIAFTPGNFPGSRSGSGCRRSASSICFPSQMPGSRLPDRKRNRCIGSCRSWANAPYRSGGDGRFNTAGNGPAVFPNQNRIWMHFLPAPSSLIDKKVFSRRWHHTRTSRSKVGQSPIASRISYL